MTFSHVGRGALTPTFLYECLIIVGVRAPRPTRREEALC